MVGRTSYSFDQSGLGWRLHWLWMQCCQVTLGMQWWDSPLLQQQWASITTVTKRLNWLSAIKARVINEILSFSPLLRMQPHKHHWLFYTPIRGNCYIVALLGFQDILVSAPCHTLVHLILWSKFFIAGFKKSCSKCNQHFIRTAHLWDKDQCFE